MAMPEPPGVAPEPRQKRARTASAAPRRSPLSLMWYRFVQWMAALLFCAFCTVRATGRRNLPGSGPALVVSNHLSHLDVFVLGLSQSRPLNYVARSTLFKPILGPLIRSVGGFAIQREGMGAQGLKETLRRLRAGGMVVLFPEGTRSRTGELSTVKAGIASVAKHAKVPIIPAGIAGTFEAWPRQHPVPGPHPVHIHYGPPITPEEIARLDQEALTALVRQRMLECQSHAQRSLARLMGS